MERGFSPAAAPSLYLNRKCKYSQTRGWLLSAGRLNGCVHKAQQEAERGIHLFISGEHLAPKKQPHNLVCVLPIPKYNLGVRMAWTMHESTLTQGHSPLQASLSRVSQPWTVPPSTGILSQLCHLPSRKQPHSALHNDRCAVQCPIQ